MARPKNTGPTYRLTRRGAIYYVRWWEDSKWHRCSFGTADAQEAQRMLAEWVIETGRDPTPDSPSVAAILDRYKADRMAGRPEGTLCHFLPLYRILGGLNVSVVGVHLSKKYAAGRRAERAGKPIADPTIRRELGVLQAALNWAVKCELIAASPHLVLPPSHPPKDRWLTPEEVQRLITATSEPHIKAFLMLGLFTAARASAILELTWDRVDFDRRMIDLGRGNGNKRRAKVPMTDELAAMLDDMRPYARTDRVIEYRSKPVVSVKKAFAAAARRAGVPDVSPHTLRHTAASWMLQRGAPIGQVAGFLGDSIATVERVYGHHNPDRLRDAADALSSAFGLRGHLAPETPKPGRAKRGVSR